jgi:hypothetical protein
MQLRIAVNRSHLAASLPLAPASLEPWFAVPQLCCPPGHVVQLALLMARLRPRLSANAAKACLFTPGR